ncbi:MAG: guanosine-3',5'-bis(diphosphate) 3'-pyrophosphohydrolase [Gammaproteobacteria bacterium]
MFQIGDLCDLTESYLEAGHVKDIYRAYLFGAAAHEGQRRASGEPYISHPLQVAKVLAEMRMDHESIMAAILHDVIEDTPTAKEQLAEEFSEEVANLVDGVSKLTQIGFNSRDEAQAENFQKMLLAMADDIRVIVVKLADRLHNMRTLRYLGLEKRRRIARETLEIYAPIANRLGLNSIRLELEDLGFQALYPMRFRVLASEVKRARGHRKQIVKRIETAIRRRLRQEGLTGQVVGREKHLYSLYQKMRHKRLSFSEVLDVYAFRIQVDSVDMCYRVIGCVHNLYKPVPGKFKDYIAIPKGNGYQSLHTVLFGPYSVPIEVQIRTDEMHAVAESGIAAHSLYKTDEKGDSVAQKRARDWLRKLLEMQKAAGDSIEFIENVKVDLFPDEVYVFTPAAEIMELPRGATAVDFAYAVHSDVGNTCVAVKIDRRYAPLRSPLSSGQSVEVITAPWGRPNPNWLNFAVTGKARANIRNYLKNLQRGEAIELGRRLLTQALARESLGLDNLDDARVGTFLEETGLSSMDHILEEIGLGKRIATIAAHRLVSEPAHAKSSTVSAKTNERSSDGTPNNSEAVPPTVNGKNAKGERHPLLIQGTEGMVVNFGRCCYPVPGDPILGFVSSGRGIVIHTQTCTNMADQMQRPESWIDAEWSAGLQRDFPVELRIDVTNEKGILATVAAAISELNVNIDSVSIDDRDGSQSSLLFTIEVADRTRLAQIIRHLRAITLVRRIVRTRH